MLILVSTLASAQSIPGSAYNVFGFGTLDRQGLVPTQNMGGVGIGLRSPLDVNLANPASLNAIVGHNQIFDIGFSYSSISQSSSSESFRRASTDLKGLNYWFRPNKKMAFSFGSSRFSDASYDITEGSRTSEAFNSAFNTRYLGEGGLSQLYFATGIQVLPNLNVGARVNFLFGSISRIENIALLDVDTEFSIEQKDRLLKPYLDFGAQYDFKISDNAKLTFGSIYRPSAKFRINEETTLIGSNADTLQVEQYSFSSLPQLVGFGVGFQNKNWLIGLDYQFETWSSLKSEDGFDYQDRHLFSFGAAYVKDRASTNYLDRIIFKGGVSISNPYVLTQNNSYWNTTVDLGVGLPLRNGSMINLGYSYQTNGNEGRGMIHESLHRVSIGFSLKDIWFVKRAYR